MIARPSGTGRFIALYGGMALCNDLAMHPGTVGHAALAAWMRGSLSQTFDGVLREPVPQAMLAILDVGTEADAALRLVQNEHRRIVS